MKRIVVILLMILLLAASALAESAEDVTGECQVTYSARGLNWKKLSDGNLNSVWKSKNVKQQTLTFQLPEGRTGGGVYLTFKEALPAGVSWRAEYQDEAGAWQPGKAGQLTYLNTFIPVEGNAFRVVFEKSKNFTLSLREARVFTQGELPEDVQVWQTPDQVDALVVLSGCGEQKLPASFWERESSAGTVVAVMTQTRNLETLERLSDLWAQGVVNYPTWGQFKATNSPKASKVISLWKEKRMNTFLAGLYRAYKPLRVYASSQDSAGADGATGKAAMNSILLAGEAGWNLTSGAKHGLYIPQALYAVEGENAQLIGQWDTQQTIAQTMQADLAQAQRPDVSAVALPDRDAQGYLAEGTFVHSDEETGVWICLSADLQVTILRCFDPQTPLTWYEADIKMRDGCAWENVFHKEGTMLAQKPELIAQTNHLVFAVNTDNYNLRYAAQERTGVIIRNGSLVLDHQGGTPKNAFPPMETLVIDNEGKFSVYGSQELTAQQYLDMGARQVYSFGPYLIRDGIYRVMDVKFYKNREPRIGIGMIEPGHYCAILVEGRLNGRSKGCDLITLGKLLYLKGCTQASNLDGGHSGVMCFMGEQINKIGNYSGKGFASARTTTELLSVGRYE
ncbi:MAG: phosphodiester glycosidase family protein [Clostridia bacterium]|nr:phosphodiester glycosidase family protein [Clostridia bacterium]